MRLLRVRRATIRGPVVLLAVVIALWQVLSTTASVCRLQGYYERAAQLFSLLGAAETEWKANGSTPMPPLAAEVEREARTVQSELGEQASARAREVKRSHSALLRSFDVQLRQAVDFALRSGISTTSSASWASPLAARPRRLRSAAASSDPHR